MRGALAALSVALLLTACATQGRVYDRDASEAFRIGVTTAEDAISALGPPDMDMVRPADNVRILRWSYRRLRGVSVDEHVLSANFDASGRLIYLHNPTAGQRIDPF